jgi:hypothetical protein
MGLDHVRSEIEFIRTQVSDSARKYCSFSAPASRHRPNSS